MKSTARFHHIGMVLRLSALWACVVLGLLVCGCSLKNPHPVGSYDRGLFWFEKERYEDAADAFGVFVRRNPTDSLAAEAQFKKAKACMLNREYPLAIVEFEIMIRDHPTSPLVEDALFHQGECYYFQVGRIERDVTPAYEARLHWLEFARRFPQSRHMPKVRRYMQEISDLMVGKRLQRVQVYRQLRRWEAVAISLDRVLEEESASSLLDEVLWQRARVAERMDEPDVAAVMYQRLLNAFPDSVYHARARSALKRLGADGEPGP